MRTLASFVAASAALAVPAACGVAVRQVDCTLWVPPLGTSPTFVAGQNHTVTWDPSTVPAGACAINLVAETWAGCGIGVPGGTLATNVDPAAGQMTLSFASVGTGAIALAFYIGETFGPDATTLVEVVSPRCVGAS